MRTYDVYELEEQFPKVFQRVFEAFQQEEDENPSCQETVIETMSNFLEFLVVSLKIGDRFNPFDSNTNLHQSISKMPMGQFRVTSRKM